jgi:hypothetical protein
VTTEERVVRAIFSAIDVVNQQLPRAERLEKSLRTALLADTGTLDSLGMVNLIVAAEQNIEDEFGISVRLLDEDVMSLRDSPFGDVNSLVHHVVCILEEKMRE